MRQTKTTEKIIMLAISIILIASSIIVSGSNKNYNYIKIAGYITLISYIIIKRIKKEPIKIIQNKMDIAIILLIIAIAIPIVTGTYVSLWGAIQTILQYIYACSIYIILREISKENQKCNKIMTNTLVISTVILIVIGFDGITSNIIGKVLETIGIGNFPNGENRLISVFGYPNVFATYIASVLFLNINEYAKQIKKEIKSIYKTITSIYIIGIILTYSKGLMLILPFIMLIYILVIKDNKQRKEILLNLGFIFYNIISICVIF